MTDTGTFTTSDLPAKAPLFSDDELSPWLRPDDEEDEFVQTHSFERQFDSEGNCVGVIATPLAGDDDPYDENSDPGDVRGLHALHGRDRGTLPIATTALDLSREVATTATAEEA